MAQPDNLSDRERQVLHFIELFRGEKGYSPSTREIAEHIGVTSTSLVDYYLQGLEAAGMIRRDKRIARSVVVL